MSESLETLKVLLLQARNTQDMEHQEQECFLERCRISDHQLDAINVPRLDNFPEVGLLDDYDAFFIGGAGEYSATKDYAWMPFVLNLIGYAYRKSIPTFGSCWGHQLIARALGGRVEHDPERAELGCHAVFLTDAGKRDPLFASFPESFMANMGHHDRVTELPPGAMELADNPTQPNEAFRMAGKPMYGTQFHSELDKHREAERLIKYREYYRSQMPSDDTFQAVLDSLRRTTEVDDLMHDFLLQYAV